MLTKAYFEDLLYGRKKSVFWGLVLGILSAGYLIALRIRYGFYSLGILKRRSLPCAVVSVGNITLGGTGKTPTVIQIADFYQNKEKRPVVISRGYGRKDESRICVVADDTRTCGDEPVLIKQKVPGSRVVVGASRYEAGKLALTQFHPGVLILDDGFQHIQLQRTADIVLVDAGDPFGNGKLFPAGILREPLEALGRADAVLITNADKAADIAALKDHIGKLADAPLFTSYLEPVDLIDCHTGQTRPPVGLQGRSVLALSGIARPAAFIRTLKASGASVAAECIYPDHYAFTQNDLDAVYKKAATAGIEMIITTEKDAVRLGKLRTENIFALRVTLKIHEIEAWEDFLLSLPANNGLS